MVLHFEQKKDHAEGKTIALRTLESLGLFNKIKNNLILELVKTPQYGSDETRAINIILGEPFSKRYGINVPFLTFCYQT
jgi:hypothetical protein